jgi:3-dehydroquinate synthase
MKISISSKINDYEVLFGSAFDSLIEDATDESVRFIIDRNVYDLYEHDFQELFRDSNGIWNCYFIDAIEDNKTMSKAQEIIKFLIASNFKRSSKLIAIGGGITQDLTCFVASILFRGVAWKFYPTTLLAQCDSCIGSKSSINVDNYKNQVGTFYPPKEIVLDASFLKTLSDDDILSGLGEAIKVHYLDPLKRCDSILEDYRLALDNVPVMEQLIYKSLLIKKDVIQQDEFDKDYRNIMNYGHTFGHAIEAVTEYKIPHGVAVTLGMKIANELSYDLGLLPKEEFDGMSYLLEENSRQHKFNITGKEAKYWAALKRDKKNVDSRIMCILTEGYGKMKKVPIELTDDIKSRIIDICS